MLARNIFYIYASASLRPEALCSRVVRPAVCLSVCLSVCFSVVRPSILIFLFEWEGEAGRWDDPGKLKKFGQGGHMGGFNK